MGSAFDMFDPRSHQDYPNLTDSQRSNRQRLKRVMTKQSFVPYDEEWWHFSLKNEPYPKTYFDFPIQ